MCLTRDYQNIPQRSLIEDCALEHAIDFDLLNDCATKDDGAFGVGMLRESVRRTADVRFTSTYSSTHLFPSNIPRSFFQAGVTKSCTIRLDNQIYCIRDDGEWVDCPHGPKVNDLVMHITKRYSA
jgi:hypothetical protein